MNKLRLLFAFIIILNGAFAQNTFILNNTPGTIANYRSLQGALDSVPSGSTILIQGSGVNYGYGNISKPVVIYGPGYLLGQNFAPFTQANPVEAQLEGLSFGTGSQGSIVSGLSFIESDKNLGYGFRINFGSTSNISVSRCYLQVIPRCSYQGCISTAFNFNNSSNIDISQCYINLEGYLLSLQSSSGITLKNNIVVGVPSLNLINPYTRDPYSYTYKNNSFYGKIEGSNFNNATCINNIIINTSANPTFGGAITYADHNVSNLNIFPATGGTNIINADAANTYLLSSGSNDGVYYLKTGSVAIGYGNDGTDAGAYGTITPYVLSGIPAIPNIYFAEVQQNATTGGGLKVRLKIKANN